MPRPPPLKNMATGRSDYSDYQILTPRTSHSRSGQAEEALEDVELEPYDVDEHKAYQSEPLLASSTSASFPPTGLRNRGDDQEQALAESNPFYPSFMSCAKNIPLGLGILLAFVLFIMILISLKKPEALLRAIGEGNMTIDENSGSPQEEITDSIFYNSSDSNIISYENYTNFPLHPISYLYECNKLTHGFMAPTEYWSDHHKDVPHRAVIDKHGPEGYRNEVCKSTITYMLGGHVGLLADLALMGQVAALAREVKSTCAIGFVKHSPSFVCSEIELS